MHNTNFFQEADRTEAPTDAAAETEFRPKECILYHFERANGRNESFPPIHGDADLWILTKESIFAHFIVLYLSDDRQTTIFILFINNTCIIFKNVVK